MGFGQPGADPGELEANQLGVPESGEDPVDTRLTYGPEEVVEVELDEPPGTNM